MISSQQGQRFVGLGILVVSLATLAYTWRYALSHEQIFVLWIVAPPALAVFSLGIVLFPMDVEKLKREHGVERVQSWSQMPWAWRGTLVLAGAAALANRYLMTGGLT